MSEPIEQLLDAAFQNLQHDTGPNNPEYIWQRKTLKESFSKILNKRRNTRAESAQEGKPSKFDRIRSQAAEFNQSEKAPVISDKTSELQRLREAYVNLHAQIETMKKRSDKYQIESEENKDYDESGIHCRVSGVLKELSRLSIEFAPEALKASLGKEGA